MRVVVGGPDANGALEVNLGLFVTARTREYDAKIVVGLGKIWLQEERSAEELGGIAATQLMCQQPEQVEVGGLFIGGAGRSAKTVRFDQAPPPAPVMAKRSSDRRGGASIIPVRAIRPGPGRIPWLARRGSSRNSPSTIGCKRWRRPS